jgi:2'-5' RNA ligase
VDLRDLDWPRPQELLDHETFRPEWSSGVECFYWYLTFDEHVLAQVIDGELGALVADTPWLEPVPVEWLHLTLCEVGFVEQTGAEAVERVVEEVGASMADQPGFELTLGPALAFPRALTLAGGPLETLRGLERRTRTATVAALGGTPGATRAPKSYWPHLSVGYVNRSVSSAELAELRAGLPELGLPVVPVDRMTLTSVVRDRRSYRWTVHTEVPLVAPHR